MLNEISSKRGGELLDKRLSSPVRFPSCRLLSRGDCIVDLQDEGASHEGGSDGSGNRLHVGSVVCLDLPLVGLRNARVLWIQAGQACCRLLVPLTESELRASVGESRPTPPRGLRPVEGGGMAEPLEIMRIPTGPALRPAPSVADRLDRMVLLGLTLVLATWIALYVLPF